MFPEWTVHRIHTYVPASHFHSGVPVDVGQQAQAEALRV